VISGRRRKGEIYRFAMELEFVDGTGIHVPDAGIEESYRAATAVDCSDPGARNGGCLPLVRENLEQVICRRRSIRAFQGGVMERERYAALLQVARAGLESDCDQELSLWSVVNRVEGMETGLYQGESCIRAGDFAPMAGYLCLEQALGSESGVTFFLTAGSGDYLPLMVKAGLVGQRIYLAAGQNGLGCSGIGAFYDAEVREFLGSDDMVLYALAVGY
jgi:hypothetical protein